ncbi:hypothetical protein FBQ97_20210 [Acidobacteria bacterium ACD]|nr:MAG: hypothetical protein EDX89_13175 [Acidobacteriota bacterium]MCE7960814.1 hypothetical protein [Acidobacteria bacterium ACB2]MDL1952113.1 hypothetical protein [Acidobacteria bacterium ACD]
MRFLETRIFTDAIADLISDDDYAALQAALISRPHLGVLIPGGGGIRKLRWHVPGRGKRGGLRVIYFWEPQPEVFFMLYAYPKSERDDLSRLQLRLLRRIAEQELS